MLPIFYQSSKLQFGECDIVIGPQICEGWRMRHSDWSSNLPRVEDVTQWLVLKFAQGGECDTVTVQIWGTNWKSLCAQVPPDCRHTWPGKHVPWAHSCPEVVGTLVFVTQVCHYIDSPVQCWGFAWSRFILLIKRLRFSQRPGLAVQPLSRLVFIPAFYFTAKCGS